MNISAQFEGWEFHHIQRDSNQAADMLARLDARQEPAPENTFLDQLFKPSVKWQGEPKLGKQAKVPTPELVVPAAIEPDNGITGGSELELTYSAHEIMAVIASWIEPIMAYQLRKELPEDRIEARQIIRRAAPYAVHEVELYKRSVTGVFQCCISLEEGQQLLQEIQAGTCGHHAPLRTLVSMDFWAGFYWLTAKADAHDLVAKCVGCQLFARARHLAATALKTIPIT